jgi:hypothetical protein
VFADLLDLPVACKCVDRDSDTQSGGVDEGEGTSSCVRRRGERVRVPTENLKYGEAGALLDVHV